MRRTEQKAQIVLLRLYVCHALQPWNPPTTPIPSAVGPHSCGAGVVQGVKVERATVRTTLTPWAATARLARVDGSRDGSTPHPPTTNSRSPAGPGPSRSRSAPAGGIVLTPAVRDHLMP